MGGNFAAQKFALREEFNLQERHASYYLAFLALKEQKIETATNKERGKNKFPIWVSALRVGALRVGALRVGGVFF